MRDLRRQHVECPVPPRTNVVKRRYREATILQALCQIHLACVVSRGRAFAYTFGALSAERTSAMTYSWRGRSVSCIHSSMFLRA